MTDTTAMRPEPTSQPVGPRYSARVFRGSVRHERCPLLTPEVVRFCRIEKLLRRQWCVSFDRLKDALQVSRATLKRDLHFMREELGAPIHFDATERGYRLVDSWSGVAAALFEQLEAA